MVGTSDARLSAYPNSSRPKRCQHCIGNYNFIMSVLQWNEKYAYHRICVTCRHFLLSNKKSRSPVCVTSSQLETNGYSVRNCLGQHKLNASQCQWLPMSCIGSRQHSFIRFPSLPKNPWHFWSMSPTVIMVFPLINVCAPLERGNCGSGNTFFSYVDVMQIKFGNSRVPRGVV